MKQSIISLSFLSLLILSGCGSKAVELPENTETAFSLGQSYTIWSQAATQENVYGLVVGDNLKNISSTIGGFITELNCQPGQKVSANDVIARITPNEDDPTMKNLHIQQASLQAQLENLKSTYDMTEQNFEIQKETLSAQTDNTQTTYNQNNADKEKLQTSIQNFKDQQKNIIMDAFKKVRDNANGLRNSSLYRDLYTQSNDIQDMPDDILSNYLQNMADLTQKASTYASGDALYSMFMGISNGFWTSKSTFDALVGSYKSAQNAYATQHNTLGLTIDLADEQAQSIENNKEIQLNSLENQMQTIQQTLDSLSNTVQDEEISAWVDGIVKAKIIWSDNKVGPNTMICQIVPTDSVGKKIQIYSAQKIDIGQIVKLFNGNTLIWGEKIQYELPYRDPATQNYIYEIIDDGLKIKEWDRLTVQFFKKLENTEVWIPVSFVFAKLDGNYVRIQEGSGFAETKVDLWDINGTLVKVNSGVLMGQTIVN